jgi:hypothetical protein
MAARASACVECVTHPRARRNPLAVRSQPCSGAAEGGGGHCGRAGPRAGHCAGAPAAGPGPCQHACPAHAPLPLPAASYRCLLSPAAALLRFAAFHPLPGRRARLGDAHCPQACNATKYHNLCTPQPVGDGFVYTRDPLNDMMEAYADALTTELTRGMAAPVALLPALPWTRAPDVVNGARAQTERKARAGRSDLLMPPTRRLPGPDTPHTDAIMRWRGCIVPS